MPYGVAHLLPPFTLSAHQLRHVLQLANPDGAQEPDQLNTDVCLQYKLPGKDVDGEVSPAGLYCWLNDYPEEGSLCIDAPWVFGPDDFNFHRHLYRQRSFSERTFGPGMRTQGVVDHIRKELIEVLAKPGDLSEWIDVAILALDGAWRTGATPEQIITALVAKQTKNEGRQWPDWHTMPADQAIEHVRTVDAPELAGPQYPAAFLVNTVNGPTYACMQHTRALGAVFGLLGAGTLPMPLDDDDQHECENCINEATTRGAA
ncbi:MAG: hypothetical protein CK604_00705 [Curvibacter sp. PD_MW3]|nr:MAG: hypothetical protein CK604_00705 [Curvibacter sp. PD_MW3]